LITKLIPVRLVIAMCSFWAWVGWSDSAFANDFCTGKATTFEWWAQELVGEKWVRDHPIQDVDRHASFQFFEGPLIASLRRLADQGDAKAQYYYAEVLFREKYACEYGPPRPAPAREAIEKYLRASSEAGFEEARFALVEFYWGSYYRDDHNVEKGVTYFEPRASAGDPFAEVFLARVFECGRGVEKNLAAAKEYFASVANETGADDVDSHSQVSLLEVAKAGVKRLRAPQVAAPLFDDRCNDVWKQ
jgi:TPR repeat protein